MDNYRVKFVVNDEEENKGYLVFSLMNDEVVNIHAIEFKDLTTEDIKLFIEDLISGEGINHLVKKGKNGSSNCSVTDNKVEFSATYFEYSNIFRCTINIDLVRAFNDIKKYLK